MVRRLLTQALLAAMMLATTIARAEALLDKVRTAHELTCGVITDQDDYSKDDTHGNLAVLGADFCKSVAVAVLGPGAKTIVSAFPDEPSGLRALRDGKIDLLGGATPSIESRNVYHVRFTPPLLYDGQGFLVSGASGITQTAALAGRQVCYMAGTRADRTLQSRIAEGTTRFQPFPFEEMGEMEAAMVTDHCAAITADVTQLANMRSAFLGKSKSFIILPELITDDPFAPAYRDGDPAWSAIVDATVSALVQAETLGIMQHSVEAMKANGNTAARRLLGAIPGLGKILGLDDDWAARVIATSGNYGELFDHDVGDQSPLRLDRGWNVPATEGGLLYALPIE